MDNLELGLSCCLDLLFDFNGELGLAILGEELKISLLISVD